MRGRSHLARNRHTIKSLVIAKGRVMLSRLFTIGALVLISMVVTVAQPEGRGPNLSPEERTLLNNIMSAKDSAAKMAAVAELIKKYPKTEVRARVAHTAAEQISAIKDAKEKLTFAQQYQTIFDQPAEEELIFPILVDAYSDNNQPDEAFTKGADFLSRHPDSLRVLVDLLAIGTSLVKQQNAKHVAETIKYGKHVVELFETDRKPAETDDVRWQTYKKDTLPSVYQSLGLLYLASGNATESKANYTKASQLAPSDPFNFVMLAAILNQEYQDAAKQYRTMAAGPARDEELKKTQGILDQVIDAYAHAIALSEGNTTLQQVRQQYVTDLETYYKYRHGSTDGMQQLIDKYKVTKP